MPPYPTTLDERMEAREKYREPHIQFCTWTRTSIEGGIVHYETSCGEGQDMLDRPEMWTCCPFCTQNIRIVP
jgi:hypothetical protein